MNTARRGINKYEDPTLGGSPAAGGEPRLTQRLQGSGFAPCGDLGARQGLAAVPKVTTSGLGHGAGIARGPSCCGGAAPRYLLLAQVPVAGVTCILPAFIIFFFSPSLGLTFADKLALIFQNVILQLRAKSSQVLRLNSFSEPSLH